MLREGKEKFDNLMDVQQIYLRFIWRRCMSCISGCTM